MAVLNNNQLGGASGQAGGYFLTDSLRFRRSATAYLQRTPSSAGNRRTYTYSCWVKKSFVAEDVSPHPSQQLLFANDNASSANTNTAIQFLPTNTIRFVEQISGGSPNPEFYLTSSKLFRDTSAWYHVVVAYDTTQSTASNRLKIYINGTQLTAFDSTAYPTLNFEGNVNKTCIHNIGSDVVSGVNGTLDGYMTEVNFVDGTALAPTDFGETDDNGTWIPKKYTGTYGTNGFYLKGRGTDNSGNGNNWTENNIDTSSGDATYDLMSDVPTLTDEDTSNFATLNPNNMAVNTTMTDGNLKASNSVNHATMFPTNMPTTGKYYFECKMAVNAVLGLGFRTDTNKVESAYSDEANKYYFYLNNSNAYRIVETTNTALGANLNNTTSTFQVAIDFDAAKYYFGRDNTWYAADWGTDGDPASGANPSYDLTDGTKMFPFVYVAGGTWTVNFGQQPFAYTPPTGYKKLNTFNLPDSTITNGREHFDTALWTGDNSNPRSFSNTAFSPDLVWYKSRNNPYYHNLYDSVRGATRTIYPNDTSAAYVNDVSGTLKSFDSDGFTVGGDTDVTTVNGTGQTYVGWQWRGSDSTAASNTDGDITSTVSANTTAGFSIVTYAGNSASSATVGHGLGVAPKAVIVKARNLAAGWPTQVDGTYGLRLNSTGANDTANGNVFFANTAPTNSVFTVGDSDEVNDGYNYVAYCFAEVEGYSKISSYVGNGSTDGPFVYTGFKPAFIMFRSTILCNWVIVDSARSTFNVMDDSLYPNTTGTEITTITDVDFLSNGFKWRGVLANETNASGQTYIYMAFAENPFKNSNAR